MGPHIDTTPTERFFDRKQAADEPDQQLRRLQDNQRLQELTEEVTRLRAIHDERAERLRALERHNEQLLRTRDRLSAGLMGGGR